MFKLFLNNEKGEAYVGQAVKIVIAIVLGAALLAGCVLVFNQVILPKVEQAIEWGFSNAEDKVEDIEDSTTFKNFMDEFNTLCREEMGSMSQAELQEICDEVNAEYPDSVPVGGLTPAHLTNGTSYLSVAYALDNGISYEEAYALTKTIDGQRELMSWMND